VQALLARSFALLARAQPQAYDRCLLQLAGLAVALKIDAEHFTVAFTPAEVRLRAVDGQEYITVGTSRQTILEVLDDRRTLAEAVISSAVEVIGPLELLLRAHEGLIRYVHGAVRCAGFPSLLQQLRSAREDGAREQHSPERKAEAHG
jgi:hypothetical protein